MKKMNNKGFSLVELIIVIAIMAVLVGVLAPQFLKYVESSRVQKDESAAAEVLNATKIACSVESVYNAISNGTTVTAADNAQVTSTVGALQNEIRLTVPDTIDYTSKLHNGHSYVVTVAINASNGTVNVTGAWN